jgi:Phage tail tube protein
VPLGFPDEFGREGWHVGELVSGANTRIMAGLEATVGTELPTPGAKALEFMIVSESFRGKQAQSDSALIGSDPHPRRPSRGKKDTAGDLKTYIQTKSFGFLALWAMGGYTPPVTAGPHYVHPFELAKTERAIDLDVEIPFSAGSKWKRAIAAVCDSFAFGFQADGFAEVTFGGVPADVQKKTAAYSAGPTDMTDELSYENVMLDETAMRLAGTSSYGKLISLSGTLNWNRYKDDYRAAKGGRRNSAPKKRATIKGTLKIGLEAEGDWDMVLAGAVVDCAWKYVIDADTYVKFTLHELTLARTDPAVPDDNPMFLDLEWTASKDATSGESLSLEIGSTVKNYLDVSAT